MVFSRHGQISLRILCMFIMIIACGIECGAFGITVEEFSRLTEPDQIEYLRQGVIRFRDRTRNISATVAHNDKAVVADPVTGLPTDKLAREGPDNEYFREFDMRRIGDSYRIAARKRRKIPKEGTTIPESIESFDAAEGESRLLETMDNKEGKRVPFGFISGQRSQAGQVCFFYSYLGDTPDRRSQDDPGTWFLENLESAKVSSVDKETSITEVTFPYPQVMGNYRTVGARGTCAVRFDLSKGAIPVEMDILRETGRVDGSARTYRMELKFYDLKAFDDVWMPTKMRAVAMTSTSPGTVTVHEGTISNIKIGHLTPADLELGFPEGTEVLDELTGERFRIGAEHSRVPTHFATVEPVATPAQRNAWIWLFGTTTAVLAIAMIVKHGRRRYRSGAGSVQA